jgi:hypothetical protein
MINKFATALFVASAAFGLGAQAQANSLDKTGSLLLYPIFDNTREGLFAITVTNTNSNFNQLPSGQYAGTVDVEFVYIKDGSNTPSTADDCLEFNRTRRLTPNDTITVATRWDNPNQDRGYVYVFAKSPTSGQAISWNYLAGDSIGISGLNTLSETELVTDVPPVVFAAVAAEGANTDADNDGIRDLNGLEYAKMADKLLIPRFIAFPNSKLILIGLSGGQSFSTLVNFLAYNDNEEAFSGQVQFDCWSIYRLQDISGIFTQEFLRWTNNNPNEFFPLPNAIPGGLEYGWIRLDGAIAFSSAAQIADPAFLAVRVDDGSFGSLPYGVGEQSNGDLLPHGPFGDLSNN